MSECKLHRYVFERGEGKGVYVFRCHECHDVKEMKLIPEIKEEPKDKDIRGYKDLDNGCRLYWKTSPYHGGRVYYSDEIGGGVVIFDTGVVDIKTLLVAIEQEHLFREEETQSKWEKTKTSIKDTILS